APIRIAWLSLSLGRKSRPATATPPRIPRPPSFGVGTTWSERSLGWSMAPTRTASHLVSGTSSSASRPATRKAKRASVSVGIAVEPEGKRQQPPDLAAEVLAAGAVAVEDRSHRGAVQQALALERPRRQHLAGERLQ